MSSLTDHFFHRPSASSKTYDESSFTYQTAVTTAGAVPVATTWTAVPLATTAYSTSAASLAASTVSLPAGKWKVAGFATASNCGGSFQARLVANTSELVATGNSSHSAAATVVARSDVEAVVQGPVSLQLQYYAAAASGTLGIANLSGASVHAKLTVTAL